MSKSWMSAKFDMYPNHLGGLVEGESYALKKDGQKKKKKNVFKIVRFVEFHFKYYSLLNWNPKKNNL